VPSNSILRGVLVLAAMMIGAVAIYVVFGSGWFRGYIPILISLFTAALFALAPVLACFAQTISIERQLSKLASIVNADTKQTQYFQSAKANLSSVRPASVTQNDFAVPMLLFATIIMFCSLLSFLSIYWEDDFKLKSSLLGGLYALQDGLTDGQIEAYQSGTLVVAAVAFFGAYLALFSRMLNQINTNDWCGPLGADNDQAADLTMGRGLRSSNCCGLR
jgi:hypothetical protein